MNLNVEKFRNLITKRARESKIAIFSPFVNGFKSMCPEASFSALMFSAFVGAFLSIII